MDDEWVSCPYDRAHRVLRLRIQKHLLKCEKRYPPLAICPYNATHRMPEAQMTAHVRSCVTRAALCAQLPPPRAAAAPPAPARADDEQWDP